METELCQQRKIFFGKEHCVSIFDQDLILNYIRREEGSVLPPVTSNPTYIPDTILETLTPIMLFRHPILMVHSRYCATSPPEIAGLQPLDEDFEAFGTQQWCRVLYDYFVSIDKKPAVVEAQDFVWKTQPTMEKLCQVVGIDPAGVKETWDPVPKGYWPDHKIAKAMTGVMLSSSGLERRGKAVCVHFIEIVCVVAY